MLTPLVLPDHFGTKLPVLQKLKTVYKLWQKHWLDFPRLTKYSLGTKIDEIFIAVLELLLLAEYTAPHKKIHLVEQASIKLDALKFFLQIA